MKCFTTKSRGFINKSKSVFFKSTLSSRSENTGPVTRNHVGSSQIRNKTPLQL